MKQSDDPKINHVSSPPAIFADAVFYFDVVPPILSILIFCENC